MRTRQVPCDRAPRIAAMLAAFITRTGKMGQRRHRWALSPAEDKEQWSSYTLSGWLSAAFTAASQRPPRGLRMDLPQSPQRLRVRGQRHRRPAAGHPLHGGLVNKLQCPRGEVHRLLDAAHSSRVDLLRMAPQGRALRRLLSPSHASYGVELRLSVLANATLTVHPANSLCLAIEVCTSANSHG